MTNKFFPGVVFFGCFVLYLLICFITHVTPFGTKTFVEADAYIQYIYFFGYLKDVFSGQNTFPFTFSLGMGDDALSLCAYYLMSPVNILVHFFEKESIPTLFTFIVIFKASLSGATCSWFLAKRFKLDAGYIAVGAFSYAFMHFLIVQRSNIMWLDSAYMLPILCYAVYLLIHTGKVIPLAVFTAMNVVFNWYMGGITCLYLIIYFLYEILKLKEKTYFSYYLCAKKTSLFALSGLLGVGLASFVFIPTIYLLSNGAGAHFDISKLFDIKLLGHPLSILQTYVLHRSTSSDTLGTPTIYIGLPILFSAIACFLDSKTRRGSDFFLLFMFFFFFYVGG